jgi:hypothetical protein
MSKRSLLLPGFTVLALALASASSLYVLETVRGEAQSAAQVDPVPGSADMCAPQRRADEAPFLAENGAAMDKMMAGMNVKPTGHVDADFVAMMIPHHQGAIDMAMAELRYGKNEQLRRISQEIIVDQQQEIIAMRLALGQPLPASAPAPTQVLAGSPSAVSAPGHSFMSPGSMSPSVKMQ